MANGRTWAVKGVSDETREAARRAAQETGLTVGEWVDRSLARTLEEARNPRPPAATRQDVAEAVEDVAEVVREALEALGERLAARLTSLEEAVGRRTRPEPAGEVARSAAAPTAIEAVRARRRRRRGL